MKFKHLSFLGLFSFSFLVSPSYADTHHKTTKAHVHGLVKLGIVVEGLSVQASLDAPTESIFGFEHPPKTPQEEKVYQEALNLLKNKVENLMSFPSETGCILARSNIEAPWSSDAKKETSKGHSDLEAEWQFQCKSPLIKGKQITLGFFKNFKHVQKLELSFVSADQQIGKTLNKDEVIAL